MKTIKTIKLNLFAFISCPLAIYLGATGRVDWWVIIIIFLLGIEANVKYEL